VGWPVREFFTFFFYTVNDLSTLPLRHPALYFIRAHSTARDSSLSVFVCFDLNILKFWVRFFVCALVYLRITTGLSFFREVFTFFDCLHDDKVPGEAFLAPISIFFDSSWRRTIFAGFFFSFELVSLLFFNLRRSRVVEKEAAIVLYFKKKFIGKMQNA